MDSETVLWNPNTRKSLHRELAKTSFAHLISKRKQKQTQTRMAELDYWKGLQRLKSVG